MVFARFHILTDNNSPGVHCWLALASQILNEPIRDRRPRAPLIFLMARIPTSLQIPSIFAWFRRSITPLHPTSRVIMDALRPLSFRSPTSRSYRSDFPSRAAWNAPFESQQQVNSTKVIFVGILPLLIMTRSGRCSVIAMLCGTVPPLVCQPGRSA